MRKGLLGSLATLFTSAGLSIAQAPPAQPCEAPTCADVWCCPADNDSRVWASGEYLLWWYKNSPLPTPLATTAPGNTSAQLPAVLGNPDTTIVTGGHSLDMGAHHGGRFTIGTWLDCDRSFGIEANYLFLCSRSFSQFVSSGPNPAPFLVNPFLDVTPGSGPIPQENGNYLADFGSVGSTHLTLTDRLEGTELNALSNLARGNGWRWDLLGGFRYLRLHENLSFATTQVATGPTPFGPAGEFMNTLDQFDARNNFYGGQFGARAQHQWGNLFVSATAKLALGGMHQSVDINGLTTGNAGPNFASLIPTTTIPGGIYALPTNIGTFEHNKFAVLPEFTLSVGYQIREWIRASVGYNFLYVNEVLRPGDQIDRAMNTTQFPSFTGIPSGPLVGPARPAVSLHESDFWAQGINFGLELRY